jgi:quercetin dioxygenase-like cupin family protein
MQKVEGSSPFIRSDARACRVRRAGGPGAGRAGGEAGGGTSGDEDDPPGFQARSASLGASLGAARLGMTVYDLPPGEAVCPYHFHWGDEEWLIVVAGTPTLRTPEGERTLEPGDVVCFPVGPSGAHRVGNASKDRPGSPSSRTRTSSASSNTPTATRSVSGGAVTRRSTT